MKFVLAPEAVKQLESQIGYLRDVGAEHAAEWLRVRVTTFLSEHLVRYPRTGRPLGDRDLVGDLDTQNSPSRLVSHRG